MTNIVTESVTKLVIVLVTNSLLNQSLISVTKSIIMH